MAHPEPTKAFLKQSPETAMLSLQEVTSQDERFMSDIAGYIWERVKEVATLNYHHNQNFSGQ